MCRAVHRSNVRHVIIMCSAPHPVHMYIVFCTAVCGPCAMLGNCVFIGFPHIESGFLSHPGQKPIEYAYWYVNRLGYCISITLDTFNRYANLSIDTYCLDQ